MQAEPDLALLYNRSAQHHSPDRNPIIVIPGILGSQLTHTPDNSIAWGAFEPGAADPSTPEGARIIALPIGNNKPLDQLLDNVKPTSVLERLRVDFAGISLNIQAYAGILATLGAGGYRDEALGMAGEIDYGDNHYTCFQFAYDWRRDNVENARRLHEFILEKRDYVRRQYQKHYGIDKPDIKFDIAAHSMGGLITRYFLRYGQQDLPQDGTLPLLNWQGAELVERVILVGTPNAGSANTFLNLIQGEQLAPILPHYSPALLGTFPSVYQLLPRPRHKSVVWQHAPQQAVDFFNADLWRRMGWGLLAPQQKTMLQTLMPTVTSASKRKTQARQFLHRVLQRARRFQLALDIPAQAPAGLDIFLVSGDATETVRTITVNQNSGAAEIINYASGDNIVLRSSVLADERMSGTWQPQVQTPIKFKNTLFLPYDHLELTKNSIFRDNVLFWLLEDLR